MLEQHDRVMVQTPCFLDDSMVQTHGTEIWGGLHGLDGLQWPVHEVLWTCPPSQVPSDPPPLPRLAWLCRGGADRGGLLRRCDRRRRATRGIDVESDEKWRPEGAKGSKREQGIRQDFLLTMRPPTCDVTVV